jgi:hypothetical protein
MSEVSDVYWTGVGARSAAQEMLTNPTGSATPLGDIPINENAIPPLHQPNRFRTQVTGAFQISGDPNVSYRTVNVYTVNNPTRDQLNLEWSAWFSSMVAVSGSPPGSIVAGTAEDLGIDDIIFIERSF